MSIVILFHFLCAQHVSDINISIIRSLRLVCWITTLVVLFVVRCVLEFRCGWVGVVSVLQAEACNTNTTPKYNIYIYIYERRSERRLGECVMERNCTIYFIYKHYVNVYLDDIIKDNKFNCSWAHVGEMGKWTMLLDGTVEAKHPMGVLKINGRIFLKEFTFRFHTID